jgi:hypothetical protein
MPDGEAKLINSLPTIDGTFIEFFRAPGRIAIRATNVEQPENSQVIWFSDEAFIDYTTFLNDCALRMEINYEDTNR